MKRNKVIGFLLAIVMIVTTLSSVPLTASAAVWNGKAASSFAGGNGSKNSPYIIKNGEQLARMRNLVNSTNSKYFSYRKAYYKLGADIVLNGNSSNYASWGKSAPARKWTPIGSNYAFSGNFNGNGYTVSGIYINTKATRVGFFGECVDATISNLTIKNSYIKNSGGVSTGGIVGRISGNSNTAYLYNCKSTSSLIVGKSNVGGVVGEIDSRSKVYKCSNSSKVSAESVVGGVSGKATLQYCAYYSNYNTGAVSGATRVGGVCGSLIADMKSNAITVYSCSNKGAVTSTESYVGGLFGFVSAYSNLTVTKSYNAAKINGVDNCGGLIGRIERRQNSSVVVSQCTTYDSSSVYAKGSNCGGLIGNSFSGDSGKLYIKNCNSGRGTVTADNSSGGLIGNIDVAYNSNMSVSNNISLANVKAQTANAGGLFGCLKNVTGNFSANKNATVTKPSATTNTGSLAGCLELNSIGNGEMSTEFTNNIYTYGDLDLFGAGITETDELYYSNNTYTPVPNLYNQSFCNSKLNIYACAWSFSSNAVPTVSVSAGHKYKSTTKKATMKADGSVTNVCTYCNAKSVSKINKIKTVKLSTTKYKYNKKVRTPGVTVKDSAGRTLKKNTDYTVSYAKGRKKVGTYKVKVTFKGKYSGSKTLTFKIVKK